jgi:hypothetical protein
MLYLFKRRVLPVVSLQRCLPACDPWQHPALSRMNERELADLPFPRETDINAEASANLAPKHDG